jgi:hypothetical protein
VTARNNVGDATARAGLAPGWLPGRVPGSVLGDLFRAGELPHPYAGRNSRHAEWVATRTWVYRRDFHLPPLWAGQRAVLCADGADPGARIYVDATEVGVLDGLYHAGRFDVTDLVAGGGVHRLALVIPPAPPGEPQVGRTDRVTRHAPRMGYGWDFCPRLVHQGIWRALRLEIGAVHVTDVQVRPELAADLRSGQVREVSISGSSLAWKIRDGNQLTATLPPNYDPTTLVKQLADQNVTVKGTQPSALFSFLFQWILPFVLIAAIYIFLFRRMAGGGAATALNLGKNRVKIYDRKEMKTNFTDVAGLDEAVEELKEIVEFLSNPKKYQRLGGRIPKGVLLLGPPGCGKTLLARAVAGEAGVPFFYMSGSEFVEMFVGLGAARVRELFSQAKDRAPCLVFLDELDTIGKSRAGAFGGSLGSHDEREQTLNQLLVEMDGFDASKGVIIMAATNRPDVLDAALLRPGRFDRQVVVDRPDLRGREAILKVHARGVAIDPAADLRVIASRTPGSSCPSTEEEREPVEIGTLVATGLIQVITVNSEAEAITFINLAREMDDGEAMTCALAIHRQCDVATDDRKARRVLSGRAPRVPIISTLAIVKQWADLVGVTKAELKAILLNIWSGANYYPGEREPLYAWWVDILS